jgi:hypothetical protein
VLDATSREKVQKSIELLFPADRLYKLRWFFLRWHYTLVNITLQLHSRIKVQINAIIILKMFVKKNFPWKVENVLLSRSLFTITFPYFSKLV